MTIVFNGSHRSIVNKPLSRSSLHQYLCVHHPHPGGHERVRQEMDGCVAATQEYPGTIPPKISRHYPPKRFPNPGWLGQSGGWLPAFQMAGIQKRPLSQRKMSRLYFQRRWRCLWNQRWSLDRGHIRVAGCGEHDNQVPCWTIPLSQTISPSQTIPPSKKPRFQKTKKSNLNNLL